MPAPPLNDLLAPGRNLEPAGGRILTALPGDPGAPYDRHAAVYDRLIGNRLYNRALWGIDPAAYRAFAEEAVAAGDGPFLDAGCGTAVFTEPVYATTTRRLVLVDRSTGMLEKAAPRVEHASLVQADIHDLPFAPGSFATVACFAMLHVLADPFDALRTLGPLVAPGGTLFASMLVKDRVVGRTYMRVLKRAGEVGPPRTVAELERAAKATLPDATVERRGSMAFLRASA